MINNLPNHALYSFIKEFIASNGYSPTRDEILAGMGKTSVRQYKIEMGRLEMHDLITFTPGKALSIKILGENHATP